MRSYMICLLFVVSHLPVLAQVAAKHVEQLFRDLAGDHIKSPMELEFPLAVADRSLNHG